MCTHISIYLGSTLNIGFRLVTQEIADYEI